MCSTCHDYTPPPLYLLLCFHIMVLSMPPSRQRNCIPKPQSSAAPQHHLHLLYIATTHSFPPFHFVVVVAPAAAPTTPFVSLHFFWKFFSTPPPVPSRSFDPNCRSFGWCHRSLWWLVPLLRKLCFLKIQKWNDGDVSMRCILTWWCSDIRKKERYNIKIGTASRLTIIFFTYRLAWCWE